MRDKRRSFDASFKLQIAWMVREEGASITAVCRDMNPGEPVVRRWVSQFDAGLSGGAGIGKPLTAEHQHICELEQENRRLREDNDLLKKYRPSLSGN